MQLVRFSRIFVSYSQLYLRVTTTKTPREFVSNPVNDDQVFPANIVFPACLFKSFLINVPKLFHDKHTRFVYLKQAALVITNKEFPEQIAAYLLSVQDY